MRAPTSSSPAKRSAARAPGTWARARRWIQRLLGRAVHEPEARAPRRASTLDKSELERVRLDLAAVLDQHPESRQVMRHARALERGLEKRGRFALDDLPVQVIRRALEQLDTLVTDWSVEGLSTLRSKAAVAVADRERVENERDAVRRSASEDEVEVEEASVTTFMRASEEWERSFTGRTDRTPLDEAAVDPDDVPPSPDKAGQPPRG
jgi:hypothetical protein